MQLSQPHLILHFDVNKTVVQSDVAQNKTCAEVASDIANECSWGTVKEGVWTWDGIPPHVRTDPDAVSHMNFLENTYAYGDPDLMAAQKAKRRKGKHRFFEKGQPGDQPVIRKFREMLIQNLRLPDSAKERAAAVGLDTEWVFLLPSFFETLVRLREQGRSFTLVFRTFGEDIEEIAHELNIFCAGKHPLFPGVRFDGSPDASGVDLRLDIHQGFQIGAAFRSDTETSIILGSTKQLSRAQQSKKKEGAASFARSLDVETRLVEGPSAIGKFFRSRTGAFAIRDDWPWWRQHGEVATAGKIFVIDPSDAGCHQIFFDDNVKPHRLKIIDPRGPGGQPLTDKEVRDVFVSRVRPLLAITQRDFFLRAIASCEKRRSDRTA